jgi:hypothetical protein
MSYLYGLFAGFVVCLPSWLVLRYLSVEAGVLVGLFLMTFFFVATTYAHSDEYTERHSKIVESIENTERVILDAIRWTEVRIDALPESLAPIQSPPNGLEKSLEMLHRILDEPEAAGQEGVPSAEATSSSR